ncbi:MAG: hypothetical protein KF852_04165 [Saprospiraceae bacterium]|nr:hypothetical protein [Saprospiraceae bacterium]
MKKALGLIALVFCAGICNGVMDTLQFHYTGSVFARMNENFWNPAKSWENKYKKGEDGKLVQPLQPRYWGSTTYFSFTTDAWHLFKFLYQGLLRAALVVLLAAAAKTWNIRVRLYMAVLIWIALAFVQALGFHITYSLI